MGVAPNHLFQQDFCSLINIINHLCDTPIQGNHQVTRILRLGTLASRRQSYVTGLGLFDVFFTSVVQKRSKKNANHTDIWGFPYMGVPQNGWLMTGGTPILGNRHRQILQTRHVLQMKHVFLHGFSGLRRVRPCAQSDVSAVKYVDHCFTWFCPWGIFKVLHL